MSPDPAHWSTIEWVFLAIIALLFIGISVAGLAWMFSRWRGAPLAPLAEPAPVVLIALGGWAVFQSAGMLLPELFLIGIGAGPPLRSILQLPLSLLAAGLGMTVYSAVLLILPAVFGGQTASSYGFGRWGLLSAAWKGAATLLLLVPGWLGVTIVPLVFQALGLRVDQSVVTFLRDQIERGNIAVFGLGLFSVVLMAPVLEELLFRGLLFRALIPRIGVAGASKAPPSHS